MWLYLAGAVMLQLILCSQAISVADGRADKSLSNCMTAYLSCFTWFVCEYLWHEDVHTYTYDIFCERVGFKLTWGCLFFYPCFYSIGGWCMVPCSLPLPPSLFALN
jgi:delta14-sterol reductase